MEIERKDLDEAVAAGILSAAQAQALWAHLTPRSAPRARFTGLNVAYYFGALVVISAMGWLMTLGFQSLGPWAVGGIAVAYALAFLVAGNYRDFFPYIRSSFIWMEAGTVLAALFALRKVRFSFLVAPAAVALWFMSMDLAAYLSGHPGWDLPLARNVSLVFGLVMLFVAYLAARRT